MVGESAAALIIPFFAPPNAPSQATYTARRLLYNAQSHVAENYVRAAIYEGAC
jgi:hypothetical protein